MTVLYTGTLILILSAGAFGIAAKAAPEVDPKFCHHDPAAAPMSVVTTKATHEQYTVPVVPMIDADGKKVDFEAAINDGRPVMLNFIFTTCRAICPVMARNFAKAQEQLGREASGLHMVSVSIDPEQDSPARLAAYGEQFKAGRQWSFYTGTLNNSVTIQKAFDAYHGDKMNHSPLTLMRRAPGQPWVRIDVLASPEELAKQYRAMMTTTPQIAGR